MRALRARFFLPVIILCVFATPSAAQQLSLSGTVRDNAGVIPGATVVLSSGGSQVSTVTTDEGAVVSKTEEVRDSSELQGRRGGYGYATRIATKGLTPGLVKKTSP